MIYTSCFSRLSHIDLNVYEPISIAGEAPEWYTGQEYKKLAPKKKFFDIWKKTKDDNYYIDNFYNSVLNKLDAFDVCVELANKAPKKQILLLCYEEPGEFCHRHLVAKWLRDNFIPARELSEEEMLGV